MTAAVGPLSATAGYCAAEAAPDLLALHAARPERYPHLLESAARGPNGRFDILFAFPETTLALAADGMLYRDGLSLARAPFLDALEHAWDAEQQHRPASDLPFTGGWFLFLGYELAAEIEPVLTTPTVATGLPRAVATRFRAAIVHDHVTHQTHLVCEPEAPREWLKQMRDDLQQANSILTELTVDVADVDEDDPKNYLMNVRRVREYIAAGDVFQVNIARAWRARLRSPVSPATLYRRLRVANPAPFAGLMTLPQAAVISSSPERLVQVRGRTVRTRPIAGTYPRAANPEADQALARELLAHPKERAEHVMLIDLERNDLGRVCRPGTVHARELMTFESYPHVHHIVSEIEGELRSDISPSVVIRAIFPGGTITGCPKIRGMQIIHELENAPRGAYTGAMGYLNRNGDMDLNILIRTMVQRGTSVEIRAGAGIVADSSPERELNETRVKARGMLMALGRG